MSGKWLINPEEQAYTHPKVMVKVEGGQTAIFDDVRNFGQFKFYDNYNEVMKYRSIKNLGPDGLELPFNIEKFLELLAKERYQKKPAGEILLDQRLVAGVGNIYKAESLYLAKIDPKRLVAQISMKKRKILGEAISMILNKALEHNGSTFGTQPYLLPSGESGDAQKWHAVYGREGKECKECGTAITRLVQKDRSTFFCAKCQK